MNVTMLRVIARLGRRARVDLVDPATIQDAPWWAADALRAAGFEPAATVRVKPPLLPAQTTLLLTHADDRADARVGFMQGAPDPTVGITSWFGRWAATTGQTGRGPLEQTLHQSFHGAPPMELVGRHREALQFLAGRGHAPDALDPAGAPDRYRDMWFAEVGRIVALPRPEVGVLAAQLTDGGALAGVPLAHQPAIEQQLAAMATDRGTS